MKIKIVLYIFIIGLLSSSVNAETIDIKNGWNLFGAPTNIELNKFDNSCVDYILKYNTNTNTKLGWQHHIANGENYNYKGTNISSINEGDGFWVMASSDCIIEINDIKLSPIIEGTPIIETKEFNVFENGKFIGYVNSSSQNVIYKIIDGDDFSLFTIDSQTGKLSIGELTNFEEPIDCEKDNQFNIVVSVTDENNSSLTSSNKIFINIKNSDDKFRFFSTGIYNLKNEYENYFHYTPTFIDAVGDVNLTVKIIDFNQNDYSHKVTIKDHYIKYLGETEVNNYFVEINATDSAGNTAIQKFPWFALPLASTDYHTTAGVVTGDIDDLLVQQNGIIQLPFNFTSKLGDLYVTYKINKQPEYGTISKYSDGTWWYLPNHNYTGTDSFSYMVDSIGSSGSLPLLQGANSPTVNITVEPKAQ